MNDAYYCKSVGECIRSNAEGTKFSLLMQRAGKKFYGSFDTLAEAEAAREKVKIKVKPGIRSKHKFNDGMITSQRRIAAGQCRNCGNPNKGPFVLCTPCRQYLSAKRAANKEQPSTCGNSSET